MTSVDDESRTYEIGGSWGNRIQWVNLHEFDTPNSIFSVVGWKFHIPQEGDFLLAAMESGKTAKFQFLEIKHELDPPDMFWGKVGFIGYAD